jgi:uracil-DNA glycosylase
VDPLSRGDSLHIVGVLQEAGIDPGHAYVTACKPWLLAELDAVRPQLVVVLGATAGQAVFGPSNRDRAHGEAGDDHAALVADLRVVADHLP